MANVITDHTPEPWYLARNGAGSIVCAKAASLLPLSSGVRCLDVVARTDWGRGEEDEANAHRIVAAVNACKDIPITELEDLAATLKSLQDALREALDAWEEGDTRYGTETQLDRIMELRIQFLDDI